MTTKLTEPVQDHLYDSTKAPVAIDGDTIARTSTLYSAQTNGSASLADPLNNPTGSKTTLFVLGANSSQPFRWSTMMLRMKMVFHQLGNTAAAAPSTSNATGSTPATANPYNAPSWNMTGAFIQNIKCSINDTEIWSSTPNYFLQDWTARLLKNHTFDSLETSDHMLFTPCFDRSYTASTARTNAAVAPLANGSHTIKPAVWDSLSSPYAAYVPDALAANQFFAFVDDYAIYGSSPQAKERGRRWMSGNTHLRTITKCIPFCDLFPRFPSTLLTNARQIKIEIVWTPSVDLLDHFSTDTPASTDASASLIGCDILTDTYVPQSSQFNETMEEKLKGESDKVGFLSTQVFHLQYNAGTDLIIPGISNFDCVFIMQPARGFANGQAGANAVTYNSFGQTLLFGNSALAGTAGAIKQAADTPLAESIPITSAQMQFAGRLYPSSPIQTTQTINGGTCFDPTQLFAEYAKFAGKLDRRDLSVACPMWAFKGSMPFIALRPWADNGFHMSNQSSDLILRMQGGTASAIDVVVFRAVIAEVNADGMTVVHK